MKLPGMPSSKVNILAKAARESWPSRAREGRGGGREYPVSALPEAARNEIAARSLQRFKAPGRALEVPSQAGIGDLKTYQRDIMDARLGLINQIELLTLFVGTNAKAIDLILDIAKTGRTPAGVPLREVEEIRSLMERANARKGKRKLVCRATLSNWLKAYREGKRNIVAVAPAAACLFIVPEWADTLMELWGRPSNPCLTECMDNWPAGKPRPSYDQARRFLNGLSIQTRCTGRVGPRQLAQYRAFIHRDRSGLKPGSVFIGDGHTYKAEIAHPRHGRPFRPEITAILDVCTERWVGWSVALAENTWSVADALRHAVTTATVPSIFYYDNGSGANNKVWDDPGLGIADRLSITKTNSAPWASQARGIIERFHSTVLHKLARRDPNYVGPRMDKEARQLNYKLTRQDIKKFGASARLTSWDDFMAEIGAMQAWYNARPHSSLPKIIDPATGRKRHQSPDEAWETAIAAGWAPEPITADEGRLLFRPSIKRTTARGQVRILGNHYFAQELVPFHGCTVTVSYDIHDPSRVSISDPDGYIACEALLDANKQPYFPLSFVDKAEQKRKEGRLKRLEAHREEVLAEAGPALIEQRFVPPAMTAAELEKQAAFEAEFIFASTTEAEKMNSAPAEIVVLETRVTRFRRAMDIERRWEADRDSVTHDELGWLARYSGTSECGAARMLYEDFGEDALTEYEGQ